MENTKIILAQSSKKTHPVIGLWNISLLKSLEEFLKKDSRKIMNLVNEQNYELLKFANENLFFNINSKSDLNQAIKIEKSLKLK